MSLEVNRVLEACWYASIPGVVDASKSNRLGFRCSGRPVLNLPRAAAGREELLPHAIGHGIEWAHMLLVVQVMERIPGLSAQDLVRLSITKVGASGVEEWIPTKVWLGMVDAFFHPCIGLCFFEPCIYCRHEIIFYRCWLDRR